MSSQWPGVEDFIVNLLYNEGVDTDGIEWRVMFDRDARPDLRLKKPPT